MDRQLFPVSIFMILYLVSCSGPSAEQTWRKFKCKSFCCWRITNLGISITSIRYRSSPVWGYCICLLWLVNDIKQNRCRMKNTIRRRRIETERSERESDKRKAKLRAGNSKFKPASKLGGGWGMSQNSLITCLGSVLLKFRHPSYSPLRGFLFVQSFQDLRVCRQILFRFLVLLKVDATK